MLDRHQNHVRQAARGPVLIELVAVLRHRAVFALQVRRGRLGVKLHVPVPVALIVALIDHERIPSAGVLLPTFR